MINLLPFGEKQKLLDHRREKLAKVLGISILVPMLCLVLILVSIKFYILAEANSQKNILGQSENQNLTQSIEKDNEAIQSYNLNLAKINSFLSKEIYFTRVLDIINSVSPPDGIKPENFSLTRLVSGNIQVSVSGLSTTREILLDYKKAIEANLLIKNPKFSTSSWINAKNANFSFTFEINEK